MSHVSTKMSLSSSVLISCKRVCVQRTHNLFRLRSIVTAHINVLPNNNHCGPNLTDEFHNVKLKAPAHSLFFHDALIGGWSSSDVKLL